jgi:hypothetical protein
MKSYQTSVTATLYENHNGTHIIWIDENDQLYVTLNENEEMIEKNSKEYNLILKKYAPIFLKNT